MKKLEFRNGTVSVGDVFASSWGYEQTNVGFYQVISTHGKKQSVSVLLIVKLYILTLTVI
ncbi:hypothetical protein CQA31_23920 [Citrobacter freundii]|nr:hypothetical protein CQA31_23920 [Citrobacter freundii]